MPFTSLLFALAIGSAQLSLAHPSLGKSAIVQRDDPFPWQGVPSDGVRAPCPGLNTLANHGYINRNGSDITVAMLQTGFFNAFNMGPAVISGGGLTALSICSQATNTTCKAFNLDQLNAPHVLEHDGSLTRDDFEMKFNLTADNYNFNATIWNMTKAFYGGASYIDITHANVARTGRINQAKNDDAPGWFISAGANSKAENAFYLAVMNDPSTGRNVSDPLARLEWIDYWFSNQRLPTDLGWARPTNLITQNQIGKLGAAVGAAPTTLPPQTTATSTSSTSTSTDTSSTTTVTNSSTTIMDTSTTATDTILSITTPTSVVSSSVSSLLPRNAPMPPEIPDMYTHGISVSQLRTLEDQAREYMDKVYAIR